MRHTREPNTAVQLAAMIFSCIVFSAVTTGCAEKKKPTLLTRNDVASPDQKVEKVETKRVETPMVETPVKLAPSIAPVPKEVSLFDRLGGDLGIIGIVDDAVLRHIPANVKTNSDCKEEFQSENGVLLRKKLWAHLAATTGKSPDKAADTRKDLLSVGLFLRAFDLVRSEVGHSMEDRMVDPVDRELVLRLIDSLRPNTAEPPF